MRSNGFGLGGGGLAWGDGGEAAEDGSGQGDGEVVGAHGWSGSLTFVRVGSHGGRSVRGWRGRRHSLIAAVSNGCSNGRMPEQAYVVVIAGADPVRLRAVIEREGWQMPLAPFLADGYAQDALRVMERRRRARP